MSSPSVEEPKPGKAKRGGNGRTIAVDEPVATSIPAAGRNAVPAVDRERRFYNRELSRLDFNERVLAMAEDGPCCRSSAPGSSRSSAGTSTSSSRSAFGPPRAARRRRPGHPARRNDAARAADAIVLVRGAGRAPEPSSHGRSARSSRAAGIRIADWADLKKPSETTSPGLRDRVFPVLTPLAVDPPTRSRTSPTCR